MSTRLALSLSLAGMVLLAVGCSPTRPIASPLPGVEDNPPTPPQARKEGIGGSAANERSSAHENAAPAQGTKVPEPQRPRTVKVAAVQCSSTLGDVDGNRTKLTALVTEAAAQGAKIIVLPEAAVTGYLSQDLRTNWHLEGWPLDAGYEGKDPLPFAEPVPGPSTAHFCQLAKQLQVYVTVPLVERDTADAKDRPGEGQRSPARLFNTVCLVSPQGEVVAHYRKLTPWPVPEKSWATPGDRGVQVYDTEYGRVGLAICFDIHTILEKYQPRKIWALLYPIAWVDINHPADWFWHRLPRRVAPFNHYVIGANWSVDQREKWFGYGFSTILGPGGKVIASAKSLYGSEILYATLETATTE
jgi:predicted amidohydrolase